MDYNNSSASIGGLNRANPVVQDSMAAQQARDKPLLDVEYEQTERALIELDQSVQWLLQRIQPVCQPYAPGNSVAATASREPETPASELRMKLRNLRILAEGASVRIADVRYTIEV